MRTIPCKAVLVLAIALAGASPSAQGERKPAPLDETAKQVGELDSVEITGHSWAPVTSPELSVSQDRKRVAYRLRKDGKWFVMAAGKQEGPYDDVSDVVFLRTGELSYKAKSESKWIFVLDGAPSRPYDWIGDIGASTVFVARLGDDWFVVQAGREGNAYGEISSLHVSQDQKRLAFVTRGREGVSVVVDDKAGPTHAAIKDLRFSSDGRHYSYRFKDLAPQHRAGLAVDGKLYRDGIGAIFSSDGQRWVVRTAARSDWLLVDTQAEHKLGGRALGARFSPDGKKLAYWSLADRGTGAITLSIDGREVEPRMARSSAEDPIVNRLLKGIADIDADLKLLAPTDDTFPVPSNDELATYMYYPDMVFSNDSNRFAYRILRNEQMAVVLDAKSDPVQDRIGKIVFSPDGKHLIYQGIKTIFGGRFDGSIMFLDGALWGGGGAFSRPFGVYSIVFSPNSSRVAVESDGLVYVDGIKGPRFSNVTAPMFSADSAHVAYVGTGTTSQVVVDGTAGASNNAVALRDGIGVVFDGNDTFRYVATRLLPSKKLGLFVVEGRVK